LEEVTKQVSWTQRAKKDLIKILQFYGELYGFDKAREIISSLREKTEILENPEYDFSKIGTIDKEFDHFKRTYRKLIAGYCKITYRIGNSKIYIVRVFDMRQDPKKNL
jgi:plasmid stabilization system protein ParE